MSIQSKAGMISILILMGAGGRLHAAAAYKVTAVVAGLGAGDTVILRNNKSDALSVSNDGEHGFKTPLAKGAAYKVTADPYSPNLSCSLSDNAKGVISGAVMVKVSCLHGQPGSVSTVQNSGSSSGQASGGARSWWPDLSVGSSKNSSGNTGSPVLALGGGSAASPSGAALPQRNAPEGGWAPPVLSGADDGAPALTVAAPGGGPNSAGVGGTAPSATTGSQKPGSGASSAGAADGIPTLLAEMKFSAPSSKPSAPGWYIGAQHGGKIAVAATSAPGSRHIIYALHGTYPVPTGGQYIWAGHSVRGQNLRDVYIEFWAKMPDAKEGCKFLKIFGAPSKTNGSANTTFGLDYTGVDNGAMRQVSFGDGKTLRNDSNNVININGTNPQWIGRSYGRTAVVLTPQKANFSSKDWGTQWHHFRMHVKFNDGTSKANETPDGEYYLEIDGKVYVDARGLYNRNALNGPIDKIEFFGWSQHMRKPFDLWYYDARISKGGFLPQTQPNPASGAGGASTGNSSGTSASGGESVPRNYVSAGASNGTPALLTELLFSAPSSKPTAPGWTIWANAKKGASIAVEPTLAPESNKTIYALHGSYPVPAPKGAWYVGADYDLSHLGLKDLYFDFWAKMPGNTGGVKFLKVFGSHSGAGYADTTFGLDYTVNPGGTMDEVSYGDGTGLANDSQRIIRFTGLRHSYIGRSSSTAEVFTPQMANFSWRNWGTQWHHFRMHVKFNDGTSKANETPDGEYYVEIDGKVYVDARGIYNRNALNGPISSIGIFGWSQSQNQAFDLWYYDVRVSKGGFLP